MNTKTNHIYIGNVDRLPQWAGISTEDVEKDVKLAEKRPTKSSQQSQRVDKELSAT